MRIWVFSDLHLEIEELDRELAIPDADVCVMAGDLTRPLAAGVRWLAEHVLPHMPVIYVPGNHEFYRSEIVEGSIEGRHEAERHPDLHLLMDDVAIIDGVRFVGATLWTDYRIMGDPVGAMMHASGCMNDHRVVALRKNPWTRFLPKDALRMHGESRQYFDIVLREPFDGRTVVVTHHCPHPGSIDLGKYRGDLLNAAFVSDLSQEIERWAPPLWIHGHTHTSFDYMAGDTRILCNPRGYGRENPEFRQDLVVEI